MSLTPVDRELLASCLAKKPGSWNDFVDRFLGLFYHVIQSTAHLRSARLTAEDTEDIASEVLLQLIAGDFKALREFQGNSSLATYLTVIARRTTIHELNRRQAVREEIKAGASANVSDGTEETPAIQKSMESLEEVDRLLRKLRGKDREVVRLFYLEGRSYEEISTELDIPVNTLGTMLSRARSKLREMSTPTSHNSTMEIRSLKSMVQEEAKIKPKKK
ncbi:MAG: RNA polymerase sigma factor [Fimbriiglobus sp.]